MLTFPVIRTMTTMYIMKGEVGYSLIGLYLTDHTQKNAISLRLDYWYSFLQKLFKQYNKLDWKTLLWPYCLRTCIIWRLNRHDQL